MKWLDNYDLYLFDCDGLLVDSEPLHYQAYINMARNYGVDVSWSMQEFLASAHLGSKELEEAFRRDYPSLFDRASWKELYQTKKDCYLDLLQKGKVLLMPGVSQLIEELFKKKKRSVIVTNSFKEQIDHIKKACPILEKITHSVTRECYDKQKPDPECYLRAIELYGEKGDRIIGFEDSLRGIKALEKTPALPVLVTPSTYPLLAASIGSNIAHYEAFDLIGSSGPSLE